MEKDSKIIRISTEASAAKENFASFNESVGEELFQALEAKFQQAFSDLEEERHFERENLRKEVRAIVDSFEARMNKRFQELNREPEPEKRSSKFFEVTGTAKHIGRALKKMISVPDIDFIRRSEEVDEFGLDPEFENQLLPFFQFLHNKYWRVETLGLENIPNQGAALIVANHSGTVPADGAMIKVAVRQSHPTHRAVRFLVEDFVYHFPFMGMYMARFGGVRACQENAERLLHQKQLIVVFPEGVKGIGKLYRDRYQLQRFGRGGVIKLALKTGAPIIPTAVIGAEEIYPMIAKSSLLARPLGVPYIPITPFFPSLGPLGLLPLPSKWTIVFGAPLHFNQYGPEAANDPLLVSRLNEELRLNIQNLLKERLSKRLSIWWG